MKIKFTILTILAAVVTCQADTFTALTVTFTAKASVQADPITSGNVTIYPKPSKAKLVNKTFLATLAEDENLAGHYSAPAFPSGAKLVLLRDLDDSSQDHFVVTDSKNNVLVDVSDLLSFTIYADNSTISGKINNSTGLLTGVTQLASVEIYFDDGSTLNFLNFVGNFTDKMTDKPAKGGQSYTRVETAKVSDAQFQGEINGVSVVGNGTFTFSGSNVLSL